MKTKKTKIMMMKTKRNGSKTENHNKTDDNNEVVERDRVPDSVTDGATDRATEELEEGSGDSGNRNMHLDMPFEKFKQCVEGLKTEEEEESKIVDGDLKEYLENYQNMSKGGLTVSVPRMNTTLYEGWLKNQKRSALRHLGFLQNECIRRKNLINEYFDKIYVLNLDRRPDRWEKMRKDLDRLGIYNYERFSAVDGMRAPHYHEWRHYSKMPLSRHELIRYRRKAIGSPGSWAILKASYRMLRDAKQRGFKRILVLQDDLLFHKKFISEFAKVPELIKKDWKLLYLGATQHNWARILKSRGFYYPAGTADGAFAVGIHHSIFDELMKEIIKFNMPFDSGPLRTLQERYLYDCYVMDPNLIIADIRDSDLRHSRDLVIFGKRFHWDINLYNLT